MKIIKKISIGLTLVILIAVLFAIYMGFFEKIKLEEKKDGGYIIVGMEITGPYKDVGKSMKSVQQKLDKIKVKHSQSIGVYYDDPATVAPDKCRSLVGAILPNQQSEKMVGLESSGLKLDSVPAAKAVIAEFPLKNTLSYMIGPMKVYPAFTNYMKEKGYKSTLSYEIYDEERHIIIYVMQYE
jgi:hypothetical protein